VQADQGPRGQGDRPPGRESGAGSEPEVQDLEATSCCTARCGTGSAGTSAAAWARSHPGPAGSFDLDAEAQSLRETIRTGKGQKKARALKRLKVVSAFLNTRNSPMGMVLDCIPVIPPDLLPMVQLDGGRFATSDLNDLYRRVINRNNRLKRLLDLGAPEIIVNTRSGCSRRPWTDLFDNGRRGPSGPPGLATAR